MGDELAEDDGLERDRGVAVELERAVLGVGAEQAVEAEQHREERRDPDDAGGEAGERRAVGADGEGHDGGDHHEEQHQRQDVAALAGARASGRGR